MSTPIPGFAQRRLTPAELARLAGFSYDDLGHGYDRFGLHPSWVVGTVAALRPLYDDYFRVTSHGIDHIPSTGAAILTANHSGVVALDGMMLWMDVVRRTRPTRVPRPVADHFVPQLPFVNTLFARCGVVSGTRGNVHQLLSRGELLMIFPEGVPGIAKPWRERYHLKEFRVGHAEMAIRHRCPVVPVAIIGAEEQLPLVLRLPIRAFGIPFFPVSLLPLPLPVHYHIHYGAPIHLHDRFCPEEADDPQVVAAASAEVRSAVQALVQRALAERPGVFR